MEAELNGRFPGRKLKQAKDPDSGEVVTVIACATTSSNSSRRGGSKSAGRTSFFEYGVRSVGIVTSR